MTLQKNRILKKTDNVSIRIDSKLSDKLHEKCEEQKISLNTLINHILEKQVNWNDLANEMGWITIFRSTFRELLDSASKDTVQKIASSTGNTELKNSLNYFYGHVSLDSILDLFKKRFLGSACLVESVRRRRSNWSRARGVYPSQPVNCSQNSMRLWSGPVSADSVRWHSGR